MIQPDTIAMCIAGAAAVLVAYIESRQREPQSYIREDYRRLVESVTLLREKMAQIEERYSVYPTADALGDFEVSTRARLDKLEATTERQGQHE